VTLGFYKYRLSSFGIAIRINPTNTTKNAFSKKYGNKIRAKPV
jgi:hypothetical protein